MRILVACELPESALEELRALGAEVEYQPCLDAAALPERIQEATFLVVGAARVSGGAIALGRSLQMIVRAGAGVSNIAVEEASGQGVFVAHCPDRDAVAIAELIIGLAVALDRGIVDHAQAARAGQKRVATSDARGMAGRTLGILGFDPSGVELAVRARAFGMRVLAWSPTLTPESAEQHDVEFCNWPRELARGSDIVAVHTPPELGDEVLVDDEFLQSMRPGAHLIHVGRPGSIDPSALLEALEQNDLRVACDVSAAGATGETARCRTNLLQHPHMICTRELAGDTRQARDAVAEAVVHTIRTFLLTGEVLGCVNVCERSPATWQLVLRVRDQVGVMAGILDAVRADGINAEEITSRVFLGAKAACCTIALDERPSTEALAAIRALPDVIYLDLRAVV